MSRDPFAPMVARIDRELAGIGASLNQIRAGARALQAQACRDVAVTARVKGEAPGVNAWHLCEAADVLDTVADLVESGSGFGVNYLRAHAIVPPSLYRVVFGSTWTSDALQGLEELLTGREGGSSESLAYWTRQAGGVPVPIPTLGQCESNYLDSLFGGFPEDRALVESLRAVRDLLAGAAWDARRLRRAAARGLPAASCAAGGHDWRIQGRGRKPMCDRCGAWWGGRRVVGGAT
jgi:hypothetical protein